MGEPQQAQGFPASQWYAVSLVIVRIVFGLFWTINGALLLKTAAAGQPSWLSGWFSVWAALELGIGVCIVFGLMRKIAYGASFIVSLVIWAVSEVSGGPFGPASMDIGTGIVYALVSLLFLFIIGIFGPSPYSLDYQIEKSFPAWKSVAEMKKVVILENGKVSWTASHGEEAWLVAMVIFIAAIMVLPFLLSTYW